MKVYTVVEIAKRLGRPRTTVVDWARQYEEFLPSEGEGRNLRFKESALEVFGLISKLKEDGCTNDHIKRQLGEVVKEIIIPMANNDGNYLMQLAGKMVEMQKRIHTLSEENKALYSAMSEQNRAFREEIASELSEVKKGQEEIAVTLSRIETHKRKKFLGLF